MKMREVWLFVRKKNIYVFLNVFRVVFYIDIEDIFNIIVDGVNGEVIGGYSYCLIYGELSFVEFLMFGEYGEVCRKVFRDGLYRFLVFCFYDCVCVE